MKTCIKCKAEGEPKDYVLKKQLSGKYYYTNVCKICMNKQRVAWEQDNLEYHKKWRENNRDKCNEWTRRHFEKNRNRVLAYKKMYNSNTKEKRHVKYKEWYEKNKIILLENRSKKRKYLTETLDDRYIKEVLVIQGLNREIVKEYPILIELKRVEVLTKRKLKQAI